jgi:serine palmitoyltransferase
MTALESALQKVQEGQPGGAPWRKVFIVVEGIYSMEGDFCRLREIVALKKKYRAYLYLDEAHSIGAVGATGRGVTELLGVPTSDVDIMMGTFTKSFGSAGGYVASSRAVIDALRQMAPGSFFASAMSPPCAAQAIAAFRLISGHIGGSTGAKKLAAINANANYFRKRLQEEGFAVLGDIDSPIIPVLVCHPDKIATFSRLCLDRGLAVVVVGYPAVPVLFERVRFCISAAHTIDQLEESVKILTELGRDVGILYRRNASRADLEDRLRQSECHHKELHEAPMCSDPATDWVPEPLAPPLLQNPAATISCLASRETQAKVGTDFRLFDPLGYMARPLRCAQEAAERTLAVYGFGACGPRGFYGTMEPHLELEKAIAEHLGMEAAIHYSSGVATISSVIPALVQPGDRVIVHSEAHFGIKTGLRLCRAEVFWVTENDVKSVENVLLQPSKTKAGEKDQQRTFIVAEALSQRTGQLARLPELVALKKKYGALLVLDESLSYGALGATGCGLFEKHGIDANDIDAFVGSLEHAAAGLGGFCAGRWRLVEHQRLAGAGYCFSASCPPSACSAAVATIQDFRKGSPGRRVELEGNVKAMHSALRDACSTKSGAVLELTSSPESYVQHLTWSGDSGPEGVDWTQGEACLAEVARRCSERSTVRLQLCASRPAVEAAFDERLHFTAAHARPTLRCCASAEHTSADIEALGKALSDALRNL